MKHRNLRKSVFAAGAVAAMLVLTAIPAFAAQTVSSMRITFTGFVGVGISKPPPFEMLMWEFFKKKDGASVWTAFLFSKF